MSEQEIHALAKAIESLVRQLDNHTREMHALLAPVGKLPEIARNSQTTTQQGFSDLQQVLVETREAEVRARIEGLKRGLEGERSALGQKTEELAEDAKRIGERYQRLLEQLDAETDKQVRSVDQPVLGLLEELYPRTVGDRYRDSLLPGRRLLLRQADDTMLARRKALRTSLDRFQTAASTFLAARQQAQDLVASRVDDTRLDDCEERFVAALFVRKRTFLKAFYLDANEAASPPVGTAQSKFLDRLEKRIEGSASNCTWSSGAEVVGDLNAALERKLAGSRKPAVKQAARLLMKALKTGQITVLTRVGS